MPGVSVTESCRPRLIICIKCRAGRALEDGAPTPGARLHAALERLIASATARIDLQPVSCLANCERGCSGAIAMPGKWTYLLGLLAPEHAADLLDYGAAYAASANGTVLPSRRPASLQRVVMGRVPPMEAAL
jgi:predicted metal-binding protein